VASSSGSFRFSFRSSQAAVRALICNCQRFPLEIESNVNQQQKQQQQQLQQQQHLKKKKKGQQQQGQPRSLCGIGGKLPRTSCTSSMPFIGHLFLPPILFVARFIKQKI